MLVLVLEQCHRIEDCSWLPHLVAPPIAPTVATSIVASLHQMTLAVNVGLRNEVLCLPWGLREEIVRASKPNQSQPRGNCYHLNHVTVLIVYLASMCDLNVDFLDVFHRWQGVHCAILTLIYATENWRVDGNSCGLLVAET
jgi:hypothetical protein